MITHNFHVNCNKNARVECKQHNNTTQHVSFDNDIDKHNDFDIRLILIASFWINIRNVNRFLEHVSEQEI